MVVGLTLQGMDGWNLLRVEQRIEVFAPLIAGSALLALSMVRQMVPGTPHSLAPAVMGAAILGILWLIISATFPWHQEPTFVVGGWLCVSNGLAGSFPAGFLFWLILRRGAVLSPQSAGAVTGGLAGLTGLGILELSCPILNAFHIQIWHWGVVFISAFAGAALGALAELMEP